MCRIFVLFAVYCSLSVAGVAQSALRTHVTPVGNSRIGGPAGTRSALDVDAKSGTGGASSRGSSVQAPPASPQRKVQVPATPQRLIKWMTIEEALEKSKTEKKKIFIDVYTDWCGWCKEMDNTTFKDPEIVSYLNEKYYAVKFNAEQTGDVVYQDKTYKFKKQGSRGFHELAAQLLNNRLSYPSFVILNEQQEVIQPIPGYQNAKKLDIILHYFGTDNHKKTPWEKYERTYSKGN
jgi:thioredoxin-related protein